MNINSGVFVNGGSQVVVIGRDALWLLRKDREPHTLVTGYEDIRFLNASPHGEYLAFWSITGESFRLIDLAGQEIWSRWMNTDKVVPLGIHFSTSGDAVACFFHFEGLPGVFFCDFQKGNSTTFGCSGSPIGYDADLRYFAIDSCNPRADEKLAFYEREPDYGNLVKVPPQVVSQRLKKSPLLVDRNRCILSNPVLPMREWQGLAIQNEMAGFVILKDCNLYWFNKDSDKPEATIEACVPESDRYQSFHTIMSLCRDNVLVQIGGRFVVANRDYGVIWRGEDLSSVTLRGQRALAQYTDGTVEVIQTDGSVELKCTPPSGFTTVAADVIDHVLNIAYMSEENQTIELKTYALG